MSATATVLAAQPDPARAGHRQRGRGAFSRPCPGCGRWLPPGGCPRCPVPVEQLLRLRRRVQHRANGFTGCCPRPWAIRSLLGVDLATY